MNDQSKISDLLTWRGTSNAISSPELASGPMHSDLLEWQIPNPSGPVPAPANHSVLLPLRGNENNSKMKDIYGPSGQSLLLQNALNESLESRFPADLDLNGSISSRTTWKTKTTPLRRQFCQLALSPITSGTDNFSLPTPCARDGRDISTSNAFLSQRKRHSPSLATRILESGAPWQVITSIYCLAMTLPLEWNAARPRVTATQLLRKSRQNSSKLHSLLNLD